MNCIYWFWFGKLWVGKWCLRKILPIFWVLNLSTSLQLLSPFIFTTNCPPFRLLRSCNVKSSHLHCSLHAYTPTNLSLTRLLLRLFQILFGCYLCRNQHLPLMMNLIPFQGSRIGTWFLAFSLVGNSLLLPVFTQVLMTLIVHVLGDPLKFSLSIYNLTHDGCSVNRQQIFWNPNIRNFLQFSECPVQWFCINVWWCCLLNIHRTVIEVCQQSGLLQRFERISLLKTLFSVCLMLIIKSAWQECCVLWPSLSTAVSFVLPTVKRKNIQVHKDNWNS